MSVAGEWLALMFRILEVTDSSLDSETSYLC
jgi:hypothetical protein